ncbi:hypothetical protein SAMN05216410_1502 [Sanguibacter gelidistatuariae]|uniref:DUF2252 domain-containing protein n=1 Tax=Sanguibacter gelidistatuariae TaxID=1814289 RepID=A0A1G6K5A6_9MICO|nr:DUF2252 domain-containing protein [Sanguibacter gelidistatuariae]SDC26021.1 hypothetical protein SAMN05216410_1502 [Sanguibacter gelidistatuariae]
MSPTRGERADLGRSVRDRVPLEQHSQYSAHGRADPVALLESQALSRVPELVPIRSGRMVSSPFAHYRGGALIMAADLARSPDSGLTVQLCGDAHLSNFGIYASPERRLVFDINDFDETYPGPFEWDVKRLATSLHVAGRANGFPTKTCRKMVRRSVRGYRETMRTFAHQGNLSVWYSHVDMEDLMSRIGRKLDSGRKKQIQAVVDKARTRDSVQALSKLTTLVDGRPRIISQPPLIVPVEELWGEEGAAQTYERLADLVQSYSRSLPRHRRHLLAQYELTQVARKVVGVGSVGTRAWILLFEGIDGSDPLFLQAKEAQTSVLAGYVPPNDITHEGERVVAGQQLMQASNDIFLGWDRALGPDGVERDFYVRQLRDGKASLPVEDMVADGMSFYGRVCGESLARAHARSGDRVAIAAYLGSSDRFDHAIADFAETYAEQNERDHAALYAAITSGRVIAQTGV